MPALNGTHNIAHTNGASSLRKLNPGIYAPIPTFFLPLSEDLDIPTFEKHVVKVAQAGVGPLLCGSMGEAHHLLHEERVALIKAARRALDAAGLQSMPIITGTGAGSLRETLIITQQAANAGADYVIVITSGYFAGALANNNEALHSWFVEVADKSPLPVILYNYPGAAGGIDLDSDLIISIAKAHPNVIGCKLTCGNVGKLTRICSVVSDPSFTQLFPRSHPEAAPQFLVLGGFTDFIVPSAFANGHGAITGLANVAPYATKKLFDITERLKADLESPSPKADATLLAKAIRLQGIIAQADRTLAVGGINGTKSILERLWGYGGNPRKPLPAIKPEAADRLWNDSTVQALVQEENIAISERK